MTTYLSIVPSQEHAGAAAFHVKDGATGTWYGILMDNPAKVAQMVVLSDCYNMRSTVVCELSGGTVSSNPAITGSATVPEIINVNRGFVPPTTDVAP
jgi:hypothetical protein